VCAGVERDLALRLEEKNRRKFCKPFVNQSNKTLYRDSKYDQSMKIDRRNLNCSDKFVKREVSWWWELFLKFSCADLFDFDRSKHHSKESFIIKICSDIVSFLPLFISKVFNYSNIIDRCKIDYYRNSARKSSSSFILSFQFNHQGPVATLYLDKIAFSSPAR
jgi:hypothetical protein